MLTKNGASALIVARPSRIRTGLQTLLRTIPSIATIEQVDDGASALQQIKESQPALILLEANLAGGDLQTVLAQTKARWPHIRCLALVNRLELQRKAESAGADKVLLAGFSTTAFVAAVEALLAQDQVAIPLTTKE